MSPVQGPPLDLLYPDRLPSPRRSLQTRAIAAVLALVAGPTLLCGYLTHLYAASVMEQTLVRDSALLGEATSHLIAAHYEGELETTPAVRRAIERLMRDRRIAFLVISDRDRRVMAQRYNEPLAWDAYQRGLTPAERYSPLTLNRSIKLSGGGAAVLVVRRQMIRYEDGGPGAPGRRGSAAQVVGYLEMGLHDPRQAQMLIDLQDTTLAVAGGVLLVSVPLVVWWVRGWTGPLRRMLAATLRVGAGGELETIPVRRDDEIGLLGRAFNVMALNLSTVQTALVQANQVLERKVAERTKQLREANEHLEREMREKDQFLRAVSHDLGAPLRNIEGLTQRLMLKHGETMEREVAQKLERIAANAKAETELINDLMELSRITRHRGRREPVELTEVVRSIGQQLSEDLESRGIELRIDRTLPLVYAERTRMRQVFQNLIDNAIKYMPAEAPRREIHVGWRVVRGHRAYYVRDTGRGVSFRDREAIFQVFRRGRYSGTESVAGRGVGLASVKAIVECYGGRVWVEGAPGRGAVFYFTLGADHVIDRGTPPPEVLAGGRAG